MHMNAGLRRGIVALEPHRSDWEIIAEQTITRLHEILQDAAADNAAAADQAKQPEEKKEEK